MSKKLEPPARSAAVANRPAPVRVRLKRITCFDAKPYPPDGLAREWWQRLKSALGTASSAFVNASLMQIIEAAKLPRDGVSETAVNASLAFIESGSPRDEVEGALLIQMACTHSAAMAVLGTMGGGHGTDRSLSARAAAASRLLRAYTAQVEALRRLRSGGSQIVRVEHVHVDEGGQAIVGIVQGPKIERSDPGAPAQ